ncbi:MAG: NADH-quinone oxidoreductase subunit L [Alphaproteobacteria bacterium]|nr:NADH-quinone oxidoreductase subunit L [Alphaproteobacteria bacterium]
MLVEAVFSPLLGFILSGTIGQISGKKASQLITCSLMFFSFLLSCQLAYQVIGLGEVQSITLLTWLDVGDLKVSWSLRADVLSCIMLVVVTSVSLCVHIYSIGYMEHDETVPRFMAYLSLFTFMMLMLVTADNLIQLFFGWEGVGLASYLLIGYWYSKDSANAASMKAFLVNRVGDLGLVLGFCLLWQFFGTFQISSILTAAPNMVGNSFAIMGWSVPTLELICVFLFIGAMGKSAQLGLHTWLPDAMEGPTPVSALIHAATMVTAGVFLMVRMSPLLELAPYAREIITFVGASTAFFAGTIAMTQFDIKRVIAYSTCSQLGYMFFAIGVSAYSAAIFHLVTHAFFKALLFLGAGSVIHALSDEQDMRKMGGIWKFIPQTYAMMWIGSLALAGVPFFAGYFSKDLILEATWLSNSWTGKYAFILGMASVFMTAFYSWRLLMMTFHGEPRADEKVMGHIHEAPMPMMLPLFVLSLGAVFGGYVPDLYGWFSTHAPDFWQKVIATPISHETMETVPHWVANMAKGLGVAGIVIGVLFYSVWSSIPAFIAKIFKPLYLFFYNKWYVDELYEFIFIRRSLKLGFNFWKTGDGRIIDAYGPDGVSDLSYRIAGRASQLQTGYIYHYALAMAAGFVLLSIWYIFFQGVISA